MKQFCRNMFPLLMGVAFLAPVAGIAQKDEKLVKDARGERITITVKGDVKEKLTVVVDGDKVTVNGKPSDESKDVEVSRTKVRDIWAYGGDEVVVRGYNRNAPTRRSTNSVTTVMGYPTDSNRAMLGVTTDRTEVGVRIQSVSKGSGAEKAGLKEGDILTKFGDTKLENPDDLTASVKKKKIGDKVSLTYLRDKKEQTATAELGKWKGSTTIYGSGNGENFNFNIEDLNLNEMVLPRAPTMPREVWGFATSGPKLGLSVQDTEDGKGVVILEVDEEGNAAKAGLKEKDVIMEVDGKAVNGADEIAKIMRESKDKISVMMKLQRDGKSQNIEVKVPRKLKKANL